MKKTGVVLLIIIAIIVFLWMGNRYTGERRDEITLVVAETYPDGTTEINTVWRNKTSSRAMYGDAFFVEKLENDSWVRVQDIAEQVNFNAVGHDLPAYSKREHVYGLRVFTNGLRIGSYRITANFSVARGQNVHRGTAYAYFKVT